MSTTTLDQAIQNATATEATLNADQKSLANIQAAIAQAQTPLPAAQTLVSTDVVAFNAAMDTLSAAALASKITSPAPPPPPPPGP